MKRWVFLTVLGLSLAACNQPTVPQVDANGNPVPQVQHDNGMMNMLLGGGLGYLLGRSTSPSVAPAPVVQQQVVQRTIVHKTVVVNKQPVPVKPLPRPVVPSYVPKPSVVPQYRPSAPSYRPSYSPSRSYSSGRR